MKALAPFRLAVLLLSVAACESKASPPIVQAPVADVKSSAAPPVSSAPPVLPTADHPTSAMAISERFEKALNDGDSSAAEKLSTAACWKKECESISSQAKRKFKVKRTGDVDVKGIRGVASYDVLCDGVRPCDKVMVLVARDCSHAERWVVEDVTEDKKKRASWLVEAPAACR